MMPEDGRKALPDNVRLYCQMSHYQSIWINPGMWVYGLHLCCKIFPLVQERWLRLLRLPGLSLGSSASTTSLPLLKEKESKELITGDFWQWGQEIDAMNLACALWCAYPSLHPLSSRGLMMLRPGEAAGGWQGHLQGWSRCLWTRPCRELRWRAEPCKYEILKASATKWTTYWACCEWVFDLEDFLPGREEENAFDSFEGWCGKRRSCS